MPRIGIRLGPYDPLIYLPYVGLAYAHFFAGNFAEAASAAGRASAANPRFSVPRYLHTAALVRLGREEEAREAARVLLDLQPGFTVSGLVPATSPRQSEWTSWLARCANWDCRSNKGSEARSRVRPEPAHLHRDPRQERNQRAGGDDVHRRLHRGAPDELEHSSSERMSWMVSTASLPPSPTSLSARRAPSSAAPIPNLIKPAALARGS